MKWRFTADEFAYIWRETALDRYPSPLLVITSARTEDAAAQLESAIAAKYPAGADEDLSVALRVAARPSTIVTLITDDARTTGRSLNGTGVVITQRDATIDMTLTRESVMAATLAGTLVDVPAGRSPAMSAPQHEFTEDRPLVVLEDTRGRPDSARMRVLLGAARSGAGHVAVQRFADTETPPNPNYVSWIDVAGDGRYLVRHGANVEISPASRQDVQLELQRLTARRMFIQ